MNTPATATTPATALSAAASGILSTLTGSLKSSLLNSASAAVTFLTQLGIGFVGQEAQDFGDFVDNLVMGVEAGMSWSASFQAAGAKFMAAEKSQLMSDVLAAVEKFASLVDGMNNIIQATIGGL